MGHPTTTQDSLPVAGQALPDGRVGHRVRGLDPWPGAYTSLGDLWTATGSGWGIHNGQLKAYKGVPQEVARRLFAAPNPATLQSILAPTLCAIGRAESQSETATAPTAGAARMTSRIRSSGSLTLSLRTPSASPRSQASTRWG